MGLKRNRFKVPAQSRDMAIPEFIRASLISLRPTVPVALPGVIGVESDLRTDVPTASATASSGPQGDQPVNPWIEQVAQQPAASRPPIRQELGNMIERSDYLVRNPNEWVERSRMLSCSKQGFMPKPGLSILSFLTRT